MLFCDIELARRLEKRAVQEIVEYAETMARIGLRPDARVRAIGEGYAVFTAKNLDINRVGNLGMTGPVNVAHFEELEEFFAETGVPAQLDTCPLADTSLFQLLQERNYSISRFMNLQVRELPADEPAFSPVAGVTIEPEKGPEWVKVVAQGFAGNEEIPADDINFVYNNTVINRGTHVKCLVARVNGELAGGGAISVVDNLAYLFSTSVRPAFRGRGVQKALIQARINLAREQGCDLIFTMTNPGSNSQRNMERQNFRVAYTRPLMTKHR